MTIQKILNLDPVNGLTTAYKAFLPETQEIDPKLLFGVELEIEHVRNWDMLEVTGITSTADGSLRNDGREFLMLPATYNNAVATLSHFFDRAKFKDKNYSERCSIHVHSNCQDLTFDQLQIILFVYQIVERVLFNWVNPARASNIFCVPWYDTNLTHSVFTEKLDPNKFKNWMKYTALNLAPLYSYGTIEWRHMHGHSDKEKLFKWLRIISCFYRYARQNTLKEVSEFFQGLNTTSQYGRFIDLVFQEEVAFIYEQPTWERDLEEGVLLMKYSLASQKDNKTEKIFKYVDAFAAPAGFELAVNEQPNQNQQHAVIQQPEEPLNNDVNVAFDYAQHLLQIRAQEVRLRDARPWPANPRVPPPGRPRNRGNR